jgi:hypoxanthine phosphoribosyltransferase
VLISEERIRERVVALGERISQEYAGKNPVLVSILKGGTVFLSDLIRAISIPHEIDFLSVSSYGSSTRSSGRVRLLHDLSQEVGGRHVLLVEDIIDTGRTLAYLLDYLRLRNTASLRVCALVEKEIPGPREVEADLVGFTIPNRFVVGYGMDLAGHHRNLRFIGAIDDDLAGALVDPDGA